MGITNKNQIIDVDAIEKGCYQLAEISSQFTTHATAIKNIASQIGANVLSADKETVDDDIIDIATNVEKIEGIVNGIAGAIITEANFIYSQEQRQLDAYLASLEEDN